MAKRSDSFNPDELVRRYLDGTCTDAERLLVEDWYETVQAGKPLPDERLVGKDLEAIMGRLQSHRIKRQQRTNWIRVAAVAILFLSVGIGIYWYSSMDNSREPQLTSKYGEDVLPGGNRATLTLSDGNSIALSEDKAGIVMGDEVRYDDGTQLADGIPDDGVSMLVLTTPRGGQYQVTLPDGSKVWLNAESSLQYPTAFNGKERRVVLSGEGYFEVAHNERQPFIVESGAQSVQVLGTAFNINAYGSEEVIATTLLSGSVGIGVGANQQTVLKPGEQSILSENGSIHVEKVAVANFTAWKDGLIVLNDADMATVIRQVERWYDVEFEKADLPEELVLGGELPRETKLSGILEVLELNTGLKFTIEGRRVMVQ